MDNSAFQNLVLYSRTNKVEKLLGALTAGAEINGVDSSGRTPLMHATSAQMECASVVEVLLSRGADHNLADLEGYTALMFAAWRGYAASVKCLLTAGADPNATDFEGRTAFDHAKAEGKLAVVEILLPLTRDHWEGATIERLREFSPILCSAAVSFIQCAESVGRRGRVQQDAIPEVLRPIIPAWYALMISSVPLPGIGFEFPEPIREFVEGGWFRHFGHLLQAHTGLYPETELVKEGYFAFASSANGNVWVIRSASGVSDPVYFWDLSGMDAVEACSSFPEFLGKLKPRTT